MKIQKLSIFLIMLFLISCGKEPETNINQETVNSGNITVLCDDLILMSFSAAKPFFDSAFPDAKVNLQPIDARNAMVQLLSGKSRAIIIARDYLRDEDSAMSIHSINKHRRFLFAIDGLVFFANKNFKLDTLSKEQILEAMNSKLPTINKAFPLLKAEPIFVATSSSSSLFGNVMNQFSAGKSPVRPMKYFSSVDSVADYVRHNEDAIGIGYLSKFLKDTTIKLLRVGFADSTGKRIFPQAVHPGNIVRGNYPFAVNYYGYLLEDRMNLPWGFFTFLRTDKNIQQSFLDAGLVPAFAKLELIEQ